MCPNHLHCNLGYRQVSAKDARLGLDVVKAGRGLSPLCFQLGFKKIFPSNVAYSVTQWKGPGRIMLLGHILSDRAQRKSQSIGSQSPWCHKALSQSKWGNSFREVLNHACSSLCTVPVNWEENQGLPPVPKREESYDSLDGSSVQITCIAISDTCRSLRRILTGSWRNEGWERLVSLLLSAGIQAELFLEHGLQLDPMKRTWQNHAARAHPFWPCSTKKPIHRESIAMMPQGP